MLTAQVKEETMTTSEYIILFGCAFVWIAFQSALIVA